jgi:threonine-phosphate decarboxylase
MTVHGGDARVMAGELGIPASALLDFSANVNPRGLPPGAMRRLLEEASNPRLLGLYPDPSARRLRDALARRLNVPAEAIVVGPGAEALLSPAFRWLRGRRALVPIPAFSEYSRVCAREDIGYTPFALERADGFQLRVDCFCRRFESGAFDLAVLNNPHNPSGAALDAEGVYDVLEAVSARGGTLLLDEAFVDYVPRASLASKAAKRDGIIVVRSLTKFYGCPALRVGYAVASPKTIDGIASFLPAWAVTQLATEALAEAVGDDEYAEAAIAENARAREHLRASLVALGLTVFPSEANYLLFELGRAMPESSALRARLIERHRIVVRNCDSYEGLAYGRYVRVAVRAFDENDRLIHALEKELTAS